VGLVPLVQQVFSFRPSSYTSNETKTLFTVRDAYFRVTSADVRIETAFSGGTPTIAVGVSGGDVDNLVETGDITIGTPGVYKGTGLGLDSGGGALYAPGTAIAVTYTAHASTTQGLARIVITGYRVAA
jgi:hypothetical protein